ncbi:MAG: hypothetical protein OHK0022_45010 [Roseiflexaceae bacterium]
MNYEELRQNESRFLAMTSLTVEEFGQLVGPFEQEYVRDRSTWTNEGYQRWGRRHTSYKNSPLPTPEARLLFALVYVKQAPTQELHGQLFGMSQSNANKWLHILLPVLEATLRSEGLLPARQVEELQTRLREGQQRRPGPRPQQAAPAEPAPAPLFSTTELSDPSHDPAMRTTAPTTTVAKRKRIP